MPVFNGEKWLSLTIESLLGQSFEDFELVISDNASTDNTQALCHEYAIRDPRVVYSRNKVNIGIANNFNRVLEHSRGTYFKWTSCSDLIDRRFIERCVEVIEYRPEAILVYPSTSLFVDDPVEGENYVDTFDLDIDDPCERFIRYINNVGLNNIMHGLFRAEVLRRTELYRTFLAADYNMIAEILLHGRAVRIPGVLHFRRMHPETFTTFLSKDDLRRLYDPSDPSRLRFQQWRAVIDYYGIVVRAPITISKKFRLFGHLTRRACWLRHKLLGELFVWRHNIQPSRR